MDALLDTGDDLMTTAAGSLLIVDDEEMNRDMLGRRLELHGYRSRRRGRPAVPLTCLIEQAFDLVLLDVMMPELNGLEVLRRLRAIHARRRVAGHHGDRQEPERGHGRGVQARRQRLRHQADRLSGGPGPHRHPGVAQAGAGGAARERRRATPWRRAAPTTDCGTGTCEPTRSTTPRAGRRCSATRRARSAPARTNGCGAFTPTTCLASGPSSPPTARG